MARVNIGTTLDSDGLVWLFLIFLSLFNLNCIYSQDAWSKVGDVENFPLMQEDDALRLYLKVNGISESELTLRDSIRLVQLKVDVVDSCLIAISGYTINRPNLYYTDRDTLIDLTNLQRTAATDFIPFYQKCMGESTDIMIISPDNKQYIATTLKCDSPLIILSLETMPLTSSKADTILFSSRLNALRIYRHNSAAMKSY